LRCAPHLLIGPGAVPCWKGHVETLVACCNCDTCGRSGELRGQGLATVQQRTASGVRVRIDGANEQTVDADLVLDGLWPRLGETAWLEGTRLSAPDREQVEIGIGYMKTDISPQAGRNSAASRHRQLPVVRRTGVTGVIIALKVRHLDSQCRRVP